LLHERSTSTAEAPPNGGRRQQGRPVPNAAARTDHQPAASWLPARRNRFRTSAKY